jgi:hypothetical protein
MDNTDPVIQYEITKERLKNSEEKRFHLEESLKNAHVAIERLQANLKQESDEKSEIKVNFEVTKQKLLYAEQALTQSNQKTTHKDRKAKWTAFLASILLVGASLFIGIGASMVASTPPNSIGWAFIILGSIVDVIAAALTTLLA